MPQFEIILKLQKDISNKEENKIELIDEKLIDETDVSIYDSINNIRKTMRHRTLKGAV